MIEAQGIKRTFGKTPVLHGIDVRIGSGEFVAIMGPSGSGKSTLLYALSGIDRPDDGTIKVFGEDITKMRASELAELRLQRMGFVFQQPRLLSTINLLDNVVLPGVVAGKEPKEKIVARAQELMAQADVAELVDRDVSQASGGQLQRVAVCRALVNSPELLFCDEPTGALNSANAARVLSLIEGEAKRGTTVVMVTHDAAVAAAADRVLMLQDGRVHDDRQLHGDPAARRAALAGWLADTAI